MPVNTPTYHLKYPDKSQTPGSDVGIYHRWERIALKALFMVSLTVILFAGLQFKDFRFSDGASVTPIHGFVASRYALATTNPFLVNDITASLNDNGFAFRLVLTPPTHTHDNFMVITSVNNGDESQQFIIGHWSHYLIILSGNDFAHQYQRERLVIDTHTLPQHQWDLDLIFSPTGAEASVNGDTIANNPDFRPMLPQGLKNSFITVGNTPDRRHGWMGGLHELSLHALHDSGSSYQASPPLAHYNFRADPFTGESSVSLPGVELRLLPNTIIQRFQWFETSTHYFGNGIGSVIDITLNVAGFVSLGFSICALLLLTNSRTSAITIAVILGFLLSGFIELTQGAIPSRDSTLYDIVFNTAGTLIGALLTPLFLSLLNRIIVAVTFNQRSLPAHR